MSTAVRTQGLPAVWEPPPWEPLDEIVWQAWLAKGIRQDVRNSAARIKAVKWVLLAGLVAVAAFWPLPAPYDIVVRFIVAAGAVVMMFHAFHARRLAFAAVFVALALLYNPVVPVSSFSGDWQRAVVAASAVPFALSLVWRQKPHESRTKEVH